MRLYIKQKVFSWSDEFTVKDEQGNDKYYVKGELFSFGHKLHVYDTNHREVAYIAQKVFAWMPQFLITINGQEVGRLVKKMTFFKPSYYIEGSDLELGGDFFEYDYTLSAHGKSIMKLSKEWFTWGDSYVLDINNPQDELLSLCIVLAIDCEKCSRNNN